MGIHVGLTDVKLLALEIGVAGTLIQVELDSQEHKDWEKSSDQWVELAKWLFDQIKLELELVDCFSKSFKILQLTVNHFFVSRRTTFNVV